MPLYHCSNCHHEFEDINLVEKDGIEEYILCNWCGSTVYVLEEETPLEKMLTNGVNDLLKRMENIKNEN